MFKLVTASLKRCPDTNSFAFRAGKELGIRAPVWQKGFSEVRVLNPESFENQREYIHSNPVQARLVMNAEAYPYSSARRLSRLDPPPSWLRAELCSA